MLILLGPSASGKTESAKIIINRYPISKVVTATTRPKRISEIDGFDYHFMNEEMFLKLYKEDFFVESAKYNGYYYGTPKNELKEDKLIILEPQGLQSFIKMEELVFVSIFLKTQEECRIKRMIERKDKPEDIKRRIALDQVEFNHQKITGLDLIIDTSNITLSNLADMIYHNYQLLLKDKKLVKIKHERFDI